MTSQDPGPKGPGQIKKRSYKRQAASFKQQASSGKLDNK